MDNDYLQVEMRPKIAFYTRNARINRSMYIGSQTIIVILAALTPIFAALEKGGSGIFQENQALNYALISSSLLAVLEGVSRVFRFKNLWLRYRNTANDLANEVRQYQNQIDDYESSQNPLSLFKTRVEGIIRSEQEHWYKSVRQE